jgi:hypothetical protein
LRRADHVISHRPDAVFVTEGAEGIFPQSSLPTDIFCAGSTLQQNGIPLNEMSGCPHGNFSATIHEVLTVEK